MMKIFRYVLAALCLTLMSAQAYSQSITAYDLSTAAAGSSYGGNQVFAGTVGMEFDVNAPAIQITSLGVFDSNRDGFQNTLTTYIFNADTHALVVSQSFSGTSDTTAGVLDGYNRFLPVNGLIVLPQGHYVIAADGFAGPDTLGNETIGGFVSDSFNDGGGLITSVSPSLYAEAYLGPGTFPNKTFGDGLAFNAGTFQYSLFVPEPGPIASLLGVFGVGGALGFRKARRRAKQ